MLIERNDITAKSVAKRLASAKIGVVVRGVAGIDPMAVAAGIVAADDRQRYSPSAKLYVSIVGHGEVSTEGPQVFVSSRIEDAVDWRSTPGLAGRILVFVQDDVPKLHSLGDLDSLTERDIIREALLEASNKLAKNQRQQEFWKKLIDEIDKERLVLPLRLVEDFINGVDSEDDNPDAIPSNMWRLGLLRDPKILQAPDVAERFRRNRELLIDMGLLSEKSRKRISTVLSKVSEQKREKLRLAYTELQQFYRTSSLVGLENLDMQAVEELLYVGKTEAAAKKTITVETDKKEITEPSQSTLLRGRRLTEAVAELAVRTDDDAEKGLKEFGDALLRRLNDPEEEADNHVTVSHGFEGKNLQLDGGPTELRKLLGYACTSTSWGGVLSSDRSSIKEAVTHAEPNLYRVFDPNDEHQGILGLSLFSLLRSFDSILPEEFRFGPNIDRLNTARTGLLKHLSLLVKHPWVLFQGYPETRTLLKEYLEGYKGLLRAFARLQDRDADAIRFAAAQFLCLEIIQFHTPDGTKALLTPLHPFHLWRFHEILEAVHDSDRPLSEDERDHLSTALPDIPPLLHFVVLPSPDSHRDNVYLPHSDSYELLPTYEGRAAHLTAADGVPFLADLIAKFVSETPYAGVQLRIGLVDVPDLRAAIRAITDTINGDVKSVHVDAYYTRGQSADAEMALFDFGGDDHKVAEHLRGKALTVQLHRTKGMHQTLEAMERSPVHLAYVFDQARSLVTNGPQAERLIVSPLVISHQYEYSDRFKRGSISPSSETEQDGIFRDYHLLVQRAALLPPGQQLRLQLEAGAGLEPVNEILARGGCRWLAVGDRLLTGYAPKDSVLLGERRFAQREVAVWAGRASRSVKQFVDLMRKSNLHPEEKRIANLLHQFGHIAAGGILSLPVAGVQQNARDIQLKAFLGTILAAKWYLEKYPDALITSLDSSLARLWLRGRIGSDKRADLIGVRMADDGLALIIEPLEVKTGDPEVDHRAGTLKGESVVQLAATIEILEPIFGGMDPQPIFTPARREVLKYQLYSECFREVTDHEWQKAWYDRLNQAFALPTPALPVTCIGTIVHVDFTGSVEEAEVEDTSKKVRFVQLSQKSVQRWVGNAPQARTLPQQLQYEVETGNDEPQRSTEQPGQYKDGNAVVVSGPHYDALLGVTSDSPQYGLLGEASGRKIAIDLNHTHTISLFGVQGGGKSYSLGTIAEMASLEIPNINCLPQPLATVIFHYSPTMDYHPEFTSMIAPNSEEAQVRALHEQYGAEPKGLADVVLLVPPDKVNERRAEYPSIEVHPLKFAAAELNASHWRFLMGAVGNQSAYIRQINQVMRSLRSDMTLDGIRQGIQDSEMPEPLKKLARMRLDLAAGYIDDKARLGSLVRPGRLVIVDLRDEFLAKDEALGLFVVLLQLFAEVKYNGNEFNKLVVFDEAHKYIDSADLVAGLVEVVREMRHKGTSILVASQDPPSVPVSLIELSTQVILHRFNSPAWLKHIQKANVALTSLTPEKMASLQTGEAYVWSSKATDSNFTKAAIKVKLRPRVTRHGGDTKTAL